MHRNLSHHTRRFPHCCWAHNRPLGPRCATPHSQTHPTSSHYTDTPNYLPKTPSPSVVKQEASPDHKTARPTVPTELGFFHFPTHSIHTYGAHRCVWNPYNTSTLARVKLGREHVRPATIKTTHRATRRGLLAKNRTTCLFPCFPRQFLVHFSWPRTLCGAMFAGRWA